MDNLTTLVLAFFEGFVLIISPCILPILPIILSGSLQRNSKFKPVGIIVGFILAFTVFTFFSRKLVQLSGIDLDSIRYVSLLLLFLFAVIMISNFLTAKFEWLTQRFANVGVAKKDFSRFEFINGIAFGALVGIIWTPCAGPILAAVLLQNVLQESDWMSFLLLLSFGFGAGLPMLLIALLGHKFIARLPFLKRHSILLRKTLGIIIIFTLAYILLGNPLPEKFNSSQNIYQNKLVDNLYKPYPAPPLVGIQQWLNSKPLTLSQLKGSVVLIDFWAYSCINCIRTLPYLKDWYKKYRNKGLVIIGVHTPEFDFESKPANVAAAVKKYNIHYPVALDNQWLTWRIFRNHYWPAHYLINQQGKIVYTHIGEGNYDVTENNIRFLLGLNKPQSQPMNGPSLNRDQTPETYLGYQRLTNFRSPEPIAKDKPQVYSYPHHFLEDEWALQGKWIIQGEKIIAAEPNAAIKIFFRGKNVFAVMGTSSNVGIKVKVLLNGKLLINQKGQDSRAGIISVTQHDLYRLLQFKHPKKGIVELIVSEPGVEIYTFTFG